MKHFYLLHRSFFCLLLIFAANIIQAQIIHVTPSGGGDQSGSSWVNAVPGSQLQNTINAAVSGEQIWVATGTYIPTTGTDRSISFVMKEGVAIYGGFIGVETLLSQRPAITYSNPSSSVLSGYINGSRSEHVIFNNDNGLTNAAVLDGFTISGGNAVDNGDFRSYAGGGLCNYQSSPTIRYCCFTDNTSDAGGAVLNNSSSATFINCVFKNNTSTAFSVGTGAMFNALSSVQLFNCIFSANSSSYGTSGAIYNDESSPVITNCDFINNTPGVIAMQDAGTAVLTNCILWNNPGNGGPLYGNGYSLSHCDIDQNGYAGNNANINQDPLFTNAANGDLHLQPNSPVIDKGINSANTISTDLDGKTRIVDGIIDMGAYELQCAPTVISSQPQNTSACVDGTATFTIGVTGPNLIYKWYKDGQSARSSNNSSTLTINNITAADAGSYTVDIISNCGTVTSSAATLTVNSTSTPVVTVTNNCGSSTLSTTATGTLLWSTNETGSSINVTTPRTYTVTQTVNGCTSDAGSGVAAPKTIPSAPLVTVTNNCGSSTLSTTATGTLLWSTNETGSSINVTNAGTYTVTQTVNGCTSDAGSGLAAPKTIPSAPLVTVTNNCGSSTLSTTATGTLLWSTNQTASSINVTNADTYTVTQTVNGCTSASGSGLAAPKTIPSTPVVTVTNNCGSSTLSTTATGTLLWSTNETASSINVTSPGTYTVTQTVNGCTSGSGSGLAAPKTIPSTPVVTVTNNCSSSTLSTTATGSLLWSTNETGSSINVTNPGTYTVTQTVNGCTSDAGSGLAAPKTIPSAPLVTVTNNCGSSTLSTTATGTLLWSTNQTASSINVTNADTYTVTQTVNGCTSASGSGLAAPKTIPSTPVVTVTNNCGSSTLSTTATGTLLWSTNETGSSINVTTPNTYTVTQTVNGCTSDAGSGLAAPKTIPSAPLVTVTNNCGSSTLSTTATGSLLWSTNETGSSINVTTPNTYTVTQTVNGCTSDAGSGLAAPKTIPSAPLVTVSDNCGSSTLSTTATGTLLWSTNETGSSINVTTPNTYTVTQTVNGCTSASGSGVAAPKTIPSAPLVTVTNNCGSSTLSTTATGSLLWSTNETGSSINVTTPNTYTVTQTVNGCTSASGSGVAAPKTIPSAPLVTVTNNCGSSTLSTTATGSLLWSTNETGSSINVTTPNTYTVTQTVNGCTSGAGSGVAAPKTIPSAPLVTVTNNCGSSTLSTTATGSLLWSTNETGSSVNVTTPNTYTVTQTVNGCTSASGSGVAAPKTIPSAPLVTVTNNCGSSTLSTTATGSLLWSTNETGSSVNVTTPNTYTVTQTVNGCTSASGSGVAAPKTIPSAPLVTVTNNCGSSTLSTTATGSLLWSTNETGSSINVTTPNTYTVTQTVNGCTSGAGSGVAAPKTIPSAPLVTVTNNCGSSTLSTTATGSLLWSTNETGSSINVTTPGIYTVTQTVNGCTSNTGTGIAAPKTLPPTPPVTVTNSCGLSLLSTTCTGSLLWSTGAKTSSIIVTSAGTYTVTQTVGGCTSLAGSGIAAPRAIPATPVVTVANNCGSSTLSTTATGSLLWSNGATTSSITVTTSCTQAVVQTVNGCLSLPGSANAAPKAIPAKPLVSVVNNCGSSTLSTTSTGSLLWSTGAVTSSITAISAGTYTVTQTVNGCTSPAGPGIAAPKALPSAPVVTVVNSCGSSTLSTTCTGSLLWSTGAKSASVSISTAGTYTVTQTANGCTSSAGSGIAAPNKAATVTANNISIATTLNNCSASVAFAPGITITGTPAPSVVYKIGTTVITSPYAFPAGTTTVTVVATNSCGSVTKTLLVTVNDTQKPSITCKPGATKTVTSSTYTVSGTEFNATASDNCGTPSLIYSLGGATVAAYKSTNTSLAGVKFNIGATTITWTATDASDNTSTCTTVVKVVKSGSTSNSLDTHDITYNPDVSPATEFSVKAFPNPTSSYFKLQLNSQGYEKIKITVIDVTGRIIEQQTNVTANSTLVLGNFYHPGIYIAEILQGNNKVVLRLIKEGK